MGRNAKEILERMKRSKVGWKRVDLDAVYEGFGFIIKPGSKHDRVSHPEFRQLVTFLPRHRKLAVGYVDELILKIAQLEVLQARKEKQDE